MFSVEWFLSRFDLLEKHGCTTELASRLTYAYDKVILPSYWRTKVGTRVLILWLLMRFSRWTQWWTTGVELGEEEWRPPTQIGQDELEATSGSSVLGLYLHHSIHAEHISDTNIQKGANHALMCRNDFKIKGWGWTSSLARLSEISNCTKMSKYLLYRFFKTPDSVMLSIPRYPFCDYLSFSPAFIDFSRISVLSNCHGHHLMTSFECAQPRNILNTF